MKFNIHLLLLLVSLAAATHSRAQWTRDSSLNTKIRDTSGFDATDTHIASLANGYSYISWNENSPNGYCLHLQLVDSNGYNQWGAQGVVLDTLLGSSTYRYDLKVDNEGNAVVTTSENGPDGFVPVIYKVDYSGNKVWGIQLTDTMATSGMSPSVSIASDNHIIVAWQASGGKSFVSAQKISPGGTIVWEDNLRIKDAANKINMERPQVVFTGNDGDMLMLYVQRSGFGLGVSTMYVQRYTAAGVPVWAAPVKVSSKTIGFVAFPAPVSDGYGGFFLSFTSGNPNSASISEVYAQRVYPDGHIWNETGTRLGAGMDQHRFDAGMLYNAALNNYFVSIRFTDLSQGAAGLSLQRLDTSGAWVYAAAKEIVPLSASGNENILENIGLRSMDTALLLGYYVGTLPSPVKIKAVKVDYNGDYLWADTSVTISIAESDKGKMVMGTYNYEQLVFAWKDDRSGDAAIYAQNIQSNGVLGIRCAQITFAPLQTICVDSPAITLSAGWPSGGVYSGPGITNGIFNPATAGVGTYTIKYVYTFATCQDSATQTIEVVDCTPTGINHISGQSMFTCFPNPASNMLTIRLQQQASNVSLKLIDLNGRLIWSDHQSGSNTYERSVDVSKYPRGLYMLTISSSEGTATTRLSLQ